MSERDREALDLDPPVRARRAAPLTRREKAWVAAAALVPVLLTVLVLAPIALLTDLTAADVAGAAIVYGGLLGLAAGFVATDRWQARQCPRCRTRHDRPVPATCATCGYDLEARPRFACEERHLAYVDDGGDGRCECGRRLHRLPAVRGVGPQVVATLRIGAWLLLVLIAVGVVLRVLDGAL